METCVKTEVMFSKSEDVKQERTSDLPVHEVFIKEEPKEDIEEEDPYQEDMNSPKLHTEERASDSEVNYSDSPKERLAGDLLSCKYCNKQYKCHSKLIQHEIRHTKGEFQCGVCAKTFNSSFILKRHEAIHSDDKSFQCTVCDKRFNTLHYLKNHSAIHNTEESFQCNVCEKKFKRSTNLRQHEKIHLSDAPFECTVCGKRFKRFDHLRQHGRTHIDDQLFECTICKKKFKTPAHLRQHKSVHIDKQRYKCDICQKGFKRANNLRQHQRSHQGDQPFECPVCRKKFNRSDHLNRHVETHYEGKMFQCTICDKKFKSSSYLRMHEAVHLGEKKFECRVCKRILKSYFYLRQHEKIHPELQRKKTAATQAHIKQEPRVEIEDEGLNIMDVKNRKLHTKKKASGSDVVKENDVVIKTEHDPLDTSVSSHSLLYQALVDSKPQITHEIYVKEEPLESIDDAS